MTEYRIIKKERPNTQTIWAIEKRGVFGWKEFGCAPSYPPMIYFTKKDAKRDMKRLQTPQKRTIVECPM